MIDLARYYSDSYVRWRIVEFLSADRTDGATAAYIATANDRPWTRHCPRPVGDLWQALDGGLEISRSLRTATPPLNYRVDQELGTACPGLGLVMEYLAHRIVDEAAPDSDISEYGDALHLRAIRVPFSVYLKPEQKRFRLGDDLVANLGPHFPIPLHEMDAHHAAEVMRDPSRVAGLARRVRVRIPNHSESTVALVEARQRSDVRRFHDWFYSKEQGAPAHVRHKVMASTVEDMPECGGRIMKRPNDLLLRPAGIQHTVPIVLAKAWHPRHIAGLIRTVYETDHGWETVGTARTRRAGPTSIPGSSQASS